MQESNNSRATGGLKKPTRPPPAYNTAEVTINHSNRLSYLEGNFNELANFLKTSIRNKKEQAAKIKQAKPHRPTPCADVPKPAAVSPGISIHGEGLLRLDEEGVVVPNYTSNRDLPYSSNGVMRLFVTNNPACDVFKWAAGIQERLSATRTRLNEAVSENDALKQTLKMMTKSLGNYDKCVRENARQFSVDSKDGMESLKATLVIMDDHVRAISDMLSNAAAGNRNIMDTVQPVVAGSHEALWLPLHDALKQDATRKMATDAFKREAYLCGKLFNKTFASCTGQSIKSAVAWPALDDFRNVKAISKLIAGKGRLSTSDKRGASASARKGRRNRKRSRDSRRTSDHGVNRKRTRR